MYVFHNDSNISGSPGARPAMFEIKRGLGINDGGIMKGVVRDEVLSIGG